MKISKLFHWLYAILMLLPVAMFIPTAFYYGFNEQAQAQERTITTDNYWLTSNPNQLYEAENLEHNTLYKVSLDLYLDIEIEMNFQYLELDYAIDVNIENIDDLTPYTIYSYDSGFAIITDNENQYYFTGNTDEFYIIVVDNNLEIFNQNGNAFDLNDIFGCDLEIPNGENSTTTYTMSITDSMSTAWTNTWSNPLFSWSANGFLIAPFNYITNLFGMPNNSTFSLSLNYWLTISIVYLVFDLVMYVPLLAHRWIDKGMVE